MSDKTDRTK